MSLALVGPAVAALQSLLRVPDCLVALNAPYFRPLRAPAIVLLNRLLLEREECSSKDGVLSAELEATDPRTQHVAEVLRAENGDSLRAGVLDGGSTNTATVQWLQSSAGGASADATVKQSKLSLQLGKASELLHPHPQARPAIDLLLAMPRPLQLGRLLPAVASMGVGTIWVTGARRVEKSYFSSHLLKEENAASLRASLVEGLAQAGDTAVPRLHVRRSLRRLLEELDEERGGTDDGPDALRLLCHPRREGECTQAPQRLGEVSVRPNSRILLAVGPERGWEEPGELDLLEAHGFELVTLGARTLRTETAVVALMAVAHSRIEAANQQ